jgi:hypothetical protein
MRSSRRPAVLALLLLAGAATACIPADRPIPETLAATDVSSGWYDVGVENGKNKLSPSITLTVKNISSTPVASVQLNAVFRRVGETEEWGGAYVQLVGSDGLAPGASTKPVMLRSQLGYTSTEPRALMLKNSLFLDTRVWVFAKLGAQQWAKLGEWPITRELILR